MRVLITGATGSLGHALMLRWQPVADRIVVFSRDEFKQAAMATQWSQDNVRYFIGDVRDKERLIQALVGIDTVIHAAALKRVDAACYNPVELLKTNVLGTQNVIEASVASGVRQVVVVSSDKAVEPTNVYGSSKNVAEHLAVSANVYTVPRGTWVSVVRYGNVAWSRGSVLWTWADRVAHGLAERSLQITDKRMTRFWLTLDQAVDAIEDALETLEAGQIYVPQLKSAALVDIAQALVQGDCVVEETGLRPGGEKLHEVLLGAEECNRTEDRGGYFVIHPHLPTWAKNTPVVSNVTARYSSDTAPRMSQEEIMALLASRPV